MSASPREGWREIAWPFPRDGWPAGRAFRCETEACGGEVEVYVRPKIGFCNCDTGVADDDEVDRVADLDLISERFVPLREGEVIRVADMPGRLRAYDLRMSDGSRHAAIGIAVSRALRPHGRGGERSGGGIGRSACRARFSGVRQHDALDDEGDGRGVRPPSLPFSHKGRAGLLPFDTMVHNRPANPA